MARKLTKGCLLALMMPGTQQSENGGLFTDPISSPFWGGPLVQGVYSSELETAVLSIQNFYSGLAGCFLCPGLRTLTGSRRGGPWDGLRRGGGPASHSHVAVWPHLPAPDPHLCRSPRDEALVRGRSSKGGGARQGTQRCRGHRWSQEGTRCRLVFPDVSSSPRGGRAVG